MDLSFLQDETCIALNKIYLGFKKFVFVPQYYVAVNDKVVAQSVSEIVSMNCVKFISKRAARGLIQEDALTYLLDTEAPPQRFVRDLALGAHEGWTVTYVALQVAYYLGFEEVIIIGMDHRFSQSGPANEAATMQGPDISHFSEEYFGFGQKWDFPDLRRSEESYQVAKQEFLSVGRRIYDATVGGACSIFEKIDYRSLV